MSFLCALRRQSTTLRQCLHLRNYATKPPSSAKAPDAPATAISSCPPNTVLVGLNWLKDQQPVTALPDEDYPPWLWTLLEPKQIPDDGPGGKGEKIKLRKQNRQRIREQNFMKTQ